MAAARPLQADTLTSPALRADLPLPAFMAAAAPSHRKCPHPQCGDGALLHLRSFMHGNSLVTLSSIRLPVGKQLPGALELGHAFPCGSASWTRYADTVDSICLGRWKG
jgi:hypothetical protein